MQTWLTKLIKAYVQQLREAKAIRSEPVERAFRRVRRDRLLETFWDFDEKTMASALCRFAADTPDPKLLELIYSDRALVTRLGPDGLPTSSTSQPSLVAIMLELLGLKPSMRVLEIGTGTGYNAALMAEIVGDPSLVATLDIQPDVIEQTRRLLQKVGYGPVNVLLRDGFWGCAERAPFDRIVGTVCCTDLSPYWLEQLALNGQMLIPLQHGSPNNAPLMKIWRENNHVYGRIAGWSGFMSIQGEMTQTHPWADAQWNVEIPDFQLFKKLPPLLHAPGWGYEWEKTTLMDFHYFLALEDSRACYTQHGIGLWDEVKGIVITPGTRTPEQNTLLFGDESVYQTYLKIYDNWQRLGRPNARDFVSEFQPINGERDLVSRVYKNATDQWIIERKYFKQIVWLNLTAA